MSLIIKQAQKKDAPIILQFIKELAAYEKMEELVTATPELLEQEVFDKNAARVLIGYEGEAPVGFALCFFNFSTFLGRRGLYLEDLFVRQEHRGKGYGKALLKELAKIAVREGCGRLEWCCLDWNTPSIEFYKGLGARAMEDWTVYRMEGDTLAGFAGESLKGKIG